MHEVRATHLPHRGSRAKLITGAQKVEKPSPPFISALASAPMCDPVAFHSVRLNDIPVVIGYANFVVCVRLFALLVPDVASLHHPYDGKPNAAIGGLFVPSIPIFSCVVIRESASFTRASSPRVESQKGNA